MHFRHCTLFGEGKTFKQRILQWSHDLENRTPLKSYNKLQIGRQTMFKKMIQILEFTNGEHDRAPAN